MISREPIKPPREEYVRRATHGDIDALIEMMRRFSGETELPLTFDEHRTRETLTRGLETASGIMLVWESNEVLGGFVLGTIGNEFSVEDCAYLHKFYIEREFRGLGISGELLRAFDREAAAMDARVLFSSATAGMGERVERLYVSLFERNGYTVLGRILVKSI